MAISKTIGTASKTMARLTEIAVKSWRDPKIASLIKDSQLLVSECGGEVCTIELKRYSIKASEAKNPQSTENRIFLDKREPAPEPGGDRKLGYLERRISARPLRITPTLSTAR